MIAALPDSLPEFDAFDVRTMSATVPLSDMVISQKYAIILENGCN
jgi:hypothetical protein